MKESRRGRKKLSFTGLTVSMNWREIPISLQGNCKSLTLNDMITGTTFIFIYRTAGLSFDFPLLKYCSHTSSCDEDCPSGARDELAVAGDVTEAQVQRKG